MARTVDGETFLSSKETANKLGVHPRTLARWVKKNGNSEVKIPYVKDPFSGYLYFREEAVQNLLEYFKA